ncbi:hypothetical protein M3616_12970 [Bacillus velezensis]|uniref:hypothetical protein n=1 Tax=Bacillus velezensis TaxID=492670 RepID=UPI0003A34BDA|nr:hypothetical protein [Bacillus velezensis]AUS14821.1 hypothetical protein C0W57_00760 [Bacillus velezensis]MCM3276314.1 hypothetical protein [Bacillus velezensis]MCM3350137.1 hypothetical protein [Bacillus velezensis]PQB13133.1 hypothetical protein C5O26_00525 [Bacillus velezensis]URD65212.1 hypothetical protein M8X21_04655 [Bacillus velezensis]
MAKLDGVKTLDMVNGEITKVAYGGAAYERVEGEAKEFGSVGDLVLNGRIHCDLTVGAFYEIVINEEYGWTTVRDDIGDWHSDVLYNPRSVLFRKVAASANPSLEDRVSSAEGEIESLKSDVAALKGEPEYKRIDRSEARAGDFVKFDDPPSYLTDKEYYEIKEFAQGYPVIIDDDGDEYDTYSDEFEVYRKVSAASVEAERLKVGDYAKVVEDQTTSDDDPISDEAYVGDCVEVLTDDKSNVPFEVRIITGKNVGDTAWAREFALVRATDEEVAEAKDAAARAKFKKGAKVRLKSGGGKVPLIGFENGEIYEVSDNNFDHTKRGKRIRIEGGAIPFNGSGCATPDQLEILTEEEAAEIERKQAEEAKWAKIGREVGEYKRGDIARVVDNKCAGRVANGDIIEVLKQASGGSVVDTVHGYFLKVELITPVEARFDR